MNCGGFPLNAPHRCRHWLAGLLTIQHARAAARFDDDGGLVLLRHQDRTRWDRAAIADGERLIERAASLHRPGPYQLQAAIAALHATASSWEETDWLQIALLYDELARLAPSPVVRLNQAVAHAQVGGDDLGRPAELAAQAGLRVNHVGPIAGGRLLQALRRAVHGLGLLPHEAHRPVRAGGRAQLPQQPIARRPRLLVPAQTLELRHYRHHRPLRKTGLRQRPGQRQPG